MLAGWALVSCGGGATHEGDASLSATVQLSPTPPMVGEALLRVTATDGGTPLGPEAGVEVKVGDAGSPLTLRHESGAWVGTARFVEPGSATLVVRIESPDGRRATLRIPTTVSRGPGG